MRTYKRNRTFSEALRRDIVRQIDTGKLSVREAHRAYLVSETSIYRWLQKYSPIYSRKCTLVVEKKSVSKQTKDLEKRVAELERALGNKQIRVEYLEKILESHRKRTGEDIEKKSGRLS